MTAPTLTEWRCRCGALLARVAHPPGAATEVKCRKCGVVNFRTT